MTQDRINEENLSSIMEFDRIIHVHEDGKVTYDNSGILEPTLTMEVDADGQSVDLNDENLFKQAKSYGWDLVTGFSGQYRYHGPVMHSSESIGSGMARAILGTPGYFVSTVVECEGPAVAAGTEGNDLEPAGWVVAYRKG